MVTLDFPCHELSLDPNDYWATWHRNNRQGCLDNGVCDVFMLPQGETRVVVPACRARGTGRILAIVDVLGPYLHRRIITQREAYDLLHIRMRENRIRPLPPGFGFQAELRGCAIYQSSYTQYYYQRAVVRLINRMMPRRLVPCPWCRVPRRNRPVLAKRLEDCRWAQEVIVNQIAAGTWAAEALDRLHELEARRIAIERKVRQDEGAWCGVECEAWDRRRSEVREQEGIWLTKGRDRLQLVRRWLKATKNPEASKSPLVV
jgi:hypothetical protein